MSQEACNGISPGETQRPEKIQAFFDRLTRERLRDGESFIAVLEVCGFNDWLIRLLNDYPFPQSFGKRS